MSSNPFIDYLVEDVKKEIGDQPQFVYAKVEHMLGMALIRAAELAGFKADIEWNAPAFRTMNIIVRQA